MTYTLHGMSKTAIYRVWRAMKERCENPNNIAYERYGGRGIRVCERWSQFLNFYQDMGDRPFVGAELDRMDNNGNYEPNNCRWSSRSENGSNKRNNVYLEYSGKKMTSAQWGRHLGISDLRIRKRLKKGWSQEEALFGKKENSV